MSDAVTLVTTQSEFEAVLEVNDRVCVDFYAEWCGPCKNIAPKIEEMSKEYVKIKFIKVDVDDSDEIAHDQQVSAMPTFKFFKNGMEVGKFVGANVDKLKHSLDELKS